ncbi:MAG: DUF2851 family protein [Chloroflexi bacterium]|nr:DUF2851 family protein [Chloroflexota bacterium]
MARHRGIPEAFVCWLWQERRAGRTLITSDGRRLDVIYPGRRWGSWGPDFREAILAVDGAVVRGDVEVHVRAADWRAHGHSSDPEYAGIRLHVIFERSASGPDQATLMTVYLGAHLLESIDALLQAWREASLRTNSESCRSPEEAADLLERAGLARLNSKAARFEGDLVTVGPREALLRGASECLGYAANVPPIRALLERFSVRMVADLLRVEGALVASAALFGTAGLLPSQRGRLPPDGYSLRMEHLWRELAWPGPSRSLGWRWIGSRPANMPTRRVAALLALLHEGRGAPEEEVLAAVWELPPRRVAGALRATFQRKGDEYWRAHGDFGQPLQVRTALVGSRRAADIVVNAALPWALAIARARDDRPLHDAVIRAYRVHPRLADDQITRHMAFQVLGSVSNPVVNSACRQQGLHQLYRGWCTDRDCQDCPAFAQDGATRVPSQSQASEASLSRAANMIAPGNFDRPGEPNGMPHSSNR